ncbi:MAG: hypothetical protein R2704_03080 [Microthrixaceae bacterium]
MSIDRLEFTYLNDGRHSTPSIIHLEGEDGPGAAIEIPEEAPGDERPTTTVELDLPQTISGTSIRLVIDELRPTTPGSGSATRR